MKYALIGKHQQIYGVARPCAWLHVSASGFYAWLTRSKSAPKTAELDQEIQRCFDAQRGRAGAPRIRHRLVALGRRVSRKTVALRMRSMGLRARAARKYKATTNSNHNLPVAPNILQQNFNAPAANRVWVSDITYIWTDEGWLYLAVVLDLYSRAIVGWSINERMTSKLVGDALWMAWWRRLRPKGVIVHSDRGSQYCSRDYQQLLDSFGMVCSMSKRGDCYDNAAMESWNHSFKVEAVHGERFATRKEAKQMTFEYIELYYNRERLHSRLNYRSPADFEKLQLA